MARAARYSRARDRIGRYTGHKQLAEALVERNDRAAADLWLGLGYLRAHRTLGIARAKLESARERDPALPGLAEAFAELAAARGREV